MAQRSETMNIRSAALIVGLIMLLLGSAGFLSGITTGPEAAYPGPG